MLKLRLAFYAKFITKQRRIIMISQHNAINFWQSIRRVMVALFAVSILFGTLGAAPAKDAKKDSKSTKTTTRNAWWGGAN